ncbi:hypothetical protein [Flagellimonas meridianipacifica]|uniref:Uncharacterized protein n=1 Tax=Flagellimonas meridianipacifica TaxID=1080225 RepID=A0A2T0MIN8_9FLAO|nr:hypothetical protein [Allomuricauda pacifica]PRX57423.1 hypothetical protein CLV81_1427 [Allomuricauda pacifica]
MKKFFLSLTMILTYAACDPESCVDEVLVNSTEIDLLINYVGSMDDSDQILLKSDGTVSRGVLCAMGGVVVNNSIYDSIYITTSTNDLLKVFKPDTPGKNIYNIDQYWTIRETSKNHFEYTYTITNEDIGN